MATAPAFPLVSVEEYLNTSYEPDMEYVDGMLVEKGMPAIAHNFLGRLLLFWFARFEQQLRCTTLYDVRTEIIRGARYRLPDIMVVPNPLPGRGVCTTVPWIVIEIVSPDDTVRKTRARFIDYANLGVAHVLQMDPEEYVAHRFDKGSMIETKFQSLELPAGTVAFDSEEVFEQLRTQLNAREQGS